MEQKIEKRTVDLRHCAKCGSEEMRLEKIEWDGMGNQWNYICPTCNHEKSIEPAGKNGAILFAGLVILAAGAAIMIEGHTRDWQSWSIFGVVAVFLLGFPVKALVDHFRYKITGVAELSVEVDVLTDPLQKGIEKTEKMGFLKGFLSPLLLIVIVLGLAMIYGLLFDS